MANDIGFSKLRLPYSEAFQEAFGVSNPQWAVLINEIWPGASSIDIIALALTYCKQRNLDPFKRVVHIVKVYSPEARGYVETIWPGIAEIRTTAHRTGQYAGADECLFGPTISHKFDGDEKTKGKIVTFPEWAQITLYRTVNGERSKFVGPRVFWLESYAGTGAAQVPNSTWAKRPSSQLQKCAEAATLRFTFPEEIGNDYSAEEMEDQTMHGKLYILGDGKAAREAQGPTSASPGPETKSESSKAAGGPPRPPKPPKRAPVQADPPATKEGLIIVTSSPEQLKQSIEPSADPETGEIIPPFSKIREDLIAYMADCRSVENVHEVWSDIPADWLEAMSDAEREGLTEIMTERINVLQFRAGVES